MFSALRIAMDALLIHPPASKPAEPPLGVAVLLAHLRGQGFEADALDANLGAYLYLLDPQRLAAAAGEAPTTSLKRALRHAPGALELLRSPRALDSFGRYSTATRHLNEALSVWRGAGEERLTLGDYLHDGLSEFSPADLDMLSRGEASTLFSGYFHEVLVPRVVERRPRIVGLSVNYRHQVLPAFELAWLLRRALPGVTLVAGGGMFSSWKATLARLSLRFSAFDRVVFGPGEASFSALLRGAAPDGPFLEDGSEIAFAPDFGFARLGEYLSPRPVLPISSSRGCYWRRCLFCPESAAPTHPYRCAKADSFALQLASLARRYEVRHFHVTDNAVPLNILRQLAAQASMLEGLSWHGFVRFEEALLDEELVDRLARAGCSMLQLGLESGSQRVLDRLGKGTRLEVASSILRNLERAGIEAYVYVMLGTPGETEEDAEATLRFLEEHAGGIGFLNLAIMNLPRDARLLEKPGEYGIREAALLAEEEPLGLYQSFEPEGDWGRTEARRFLNSRLLGSANIKQIVNRTPPFFTSNHAFFFPSPKGQPQAAGESP